MDPGKRGDRLQNLWKTYFSDPKLHKIAALNRGPDAEQKNSLTVIAPRRQVFSLLYEGRIEDAKSVAVAEAETYDIFTAATSDYLTDWLKSEFPRFWAYILYYQEKTSKIILDAFDDVNTGTIICEMMFVSRDEESSEAKEEDFDPGLPALFQSHLRQQKRIRRQKRIQRPQKRIRRPGLHRNTDTKESSIIRVVLRNRSTSSNTK